MFEDARFGVDAKLRLLECVAVYANDAILITEAEPVTDDGPRIVYVNAAFERMTGFTMAEVAGKTPRILHGPLTSPDARRRIHKALVAWEPVQVELLNYDRDGRTFWVELSIVPVANDEGRFTHWISIQRDVTMRRAEMLADHSVFVERQSANLSHAIAERKRIAERLQYADSHDELTGLYNRSHFVWAIGEAQTRVSDGGRNGFGVIYFDLDRFKLVNDSSGHAVGDSLLVELTRRVRACLGPYDLLARMGGDEFAVLVEPLAERKDLARIATFVLDALREPVEVDDLSIVTTGSAGIVTNDSRYVTADDILRNADIAMYRAKRAGGDRFVLFDEEMHREALASFRLHRDLRRAIENDEFVVHFQPIVRLETGKAFAFEALVRWEHPDRVLVPPLEFIGAAEEMGAIVPIGAAVIRKACSVWRELCDADPEFGDMGLSLNVSAVQLRDAAFYDTLISAIDTNGLQPSNVQIELTESVLLGEPKRTVDLLERIRSSGVTIAIDDFGTGYSALSYLERFPIDVLKIDRSFISRMSLGARNLDIVKAIADLANILNIGTCAEGIETETERQQLLSIGLRSGQGYLFARPMHAASVSNWAAANQKTS